MTKTCPLRSTLRGVASGIVATFSTSVEDVNCASIVRLLSAAKVYGLSVLPLLQQTNI